MENKKKVAVITGASSGIGLAAAKALLARGYTVYNLSRSRCPENGVVSLRCDVCSEADIAGAFAKVAEKSGGIDLLICNAGYGISGAVEFTENADAERLFEVNFFGVYKCIKSALPLLRACENGKKAGRIIVTSSAAAVFAIPFQAFYSASKAALNSLAFALSNELSLFGIQVCAVMLGDVRTGFTDAREKTFAGDELYGGMISHSVRAMEKDERGGMSADAVGRKICRIAEKRRMPVRCTVGGKYKLFVFLSRLLPQRLQNKIIGKMYM